MVSSLASRRLTLPSRGCPKGCAFCAPLMSNVRPFCMNAISALSYATRASFCNSFQVGTRVLYPPLGFNPSSARAVRPLTAGASPELCREREVPSRCRSGPLVLQSIQNQAFVQPQCFVQEKMQSAALHKVSRSCARREQSTAAVRHAVFKAVSLQRS